MSSIKQQENTVELLQENILSSKHLLEEIFASLPESNAIGDKLTSIVMKDILFGYRLEDAMALNLAKKLHSISDKVGVQGVCKILAKDILEDFDGEKKTVGYGILMNRLEKY